MIDSEIRHQMLVAEGNQMQDTIVPLGFDKSAGQIVPLTPGLQKFDLSGETTRFYHFGKEQVVMIVNPQALYYRAGGTTHRVVDEKGMVYIVPAVGHDGCYIKVIPRDHNNPVQF